MRATTAVQGFLLVASQDEDQVECLRIGTDGMLTLVPVVPLYETSNTTSNGKTTVPRANNTHTIKHAGRSAKHA